MDNDLITTGQQPLTMSSREIAVLCEKQHKHVLRDIETMLGQITEPNFGPSNFLSSYTDSTGRSLKEYRLPKDLTVTLITGYRADLRYKVVKRLEELEDMARQPALPDFTNPAEAARAWADQVEQNMKQARQIIDMREDVAAHERLTGAEGSLNVTEAAKNLGINPRNLFTWMSQHGWIYKRAGSAYWLGYQTKCDQGLLVHKSTTVLRPDGSEKISEQVRVTPKGMGKLAKLIHPTARLVS